MRWYPSFSIERSLRNHKSFPEYWCTLTLLCHTCQPLRLRWHLYILHHLHGRFRNSVRGRYLSLPDFGIVPRLSAQTYGCLLFRTFFQCYSGICRDDRLHRCSVICYGWMWSWLFRLRILLLLSDRIRESRLLPGWRMLQYLSWGLSLIRQ